MAPHPSAALTLATYVAISAYRDPFALALNVARKSPARLRSRITRTLQETNTSTAHAAGLLLEDRTADARAVLAQQNTTGTGIAAWLRDGVALGARYQGPITHKAVEQRRAHALGALPTQQRARRQRGVGLGGPLAAWDNDEARILRGQWRPDENFSPTARQQLEETWQALGAKEQGQRKGPGKRDGQSNDQRHESPRPLFVLTNSYPHSQAGYAQRTHKLLTCIQQQLTSGQVGEPGAETPVAALTRYGYPAIIGQLDAGPNMVDTIVYERHIPGTYSPLLSRRMEAHTQQIVEHAIAHGATLIHATTDFDNGIPARAAARRLGLPFVYEMRGERERSWVASLPEDVREKAAASERYRALRALEAQLADDADLVLVLSEVHKQALEERGISGPIVVVPNGTDAESLNNTTDKRTARAELGLPDDALLVGTITAVVDYEGLDLLLEVAENLQSTHPHARVVIVGDGVALPGLKAAAKEKGLNNVIFPGRVSPQVAATYYAALDIFCVPRIDTDVTRTITPLKSIPALAQGMPVLVSDLPALKEITPPEVSQWVLERDVATWVAAIGGLADAMGATESNGPAGPHPAADLARAFAAARTWECTAESIVEAYGKLPKEAVTAPGNDEQPVEGGQQYKQGEANSVESAAGLREDNRANKLSKLDKVVAVIRQPRRVLATITTRIAYKGAPFTPREVRETTDTIDVIVPCFKAAQHLPKLLDSLEAQTLPKERFRVLVILNGPDDGAEEILRNYGDRLPLVILHSDIANAGAARNVGLDRVTADYVSFVDADDYLDPEYLEALLSVAATDRIAVTPQFYGDQPSPYSRKTIAMGQHEFPLWQQSWVLAYTPSKAVPAAYATKHRFDETLRSGEDIVYLCQLLRYPEIKVAGTALRGAYIRQLQDQSVSRQGSNHDFRVLQRQEVVSRLLSLGVRGLGWLAINERVAAQLSLM